jgi:hypothetical protein
MAHDEVCDRSTCGANVIFPTISAIGRWESSFRTVHEEPGADWVTFAAERLTK